MKQFARVLAFIATTVSVSAEAGTLHESNVDGWIVGAYSDNRTGQFSHCATSVYYKSGTSLFFHLNKNFAWSMGLANSRWNLTPGSRFNLVYYIDAGPRISAQAGVTNSKLVSIPLADSKALFENFRRGHRLMIEAPSETIGFQLTNSSAALAATLQCTQSHVAGRTAPSDPFSSQPPISQGTPSQPNAPNEKHRTEAAILVANVLATVGLPGFRILSREQIPPQDQRFDAVWAAEGGLLGAVTIVTPNVASKADDVSAVLLALDAQSCKGAFTSGRYPTQEAGGVGRLMTSCTQPTGNIEAQYSIAPRPSGGFYVFGVTGTGQNSQTILDTGKRIHEAASRAIPR